MNRKFAVPGTKSEIFSGGKQRGNLIKTSVTVEQIHVVLRHLSFSKCLFFSRNTFEQGCKIQILTGYLLKRFCCRLTLLPLKFGICERILQNSPFRTVEKSAANVLTSRGIFSQIVDFTFLIFRIDEKTSKSENNIRARCVL